MKATLITLATLVVLSLSATFYVINMGVPTWAANPILAYQAESVVKAHLSDPESAQFKNQDGMCGEVNSKNKLGGYAGFQRYIGAGKTLVFDDNSDSFEDLWQINCVLTDKQREQVYKVLIDTKPL